MTTKLIGPGDRIEFLPDSSAYQLGARTATVLDLLPYRDAMKRLAAVRGVPWPIFADEHADLLAQHGDVPMPFVRADGEPSCPTGAEGLAWWGSFIVTEAAPPAAAPTPSSPTPIRTVSSGTPARGYVALAVLLVLAFVAGRWCP